MSKNWLENFKENIGDNSVPLYKQIAEKVELLIKKKVLLPGDALPSSREMAEQLDVNRKTVVKALESLAFRGILENRERVGLYVAACDKTMQSAKSEQNKEREILCVDDGCPDVTLLPFKEITRIYRQLLTSTPLRVQLGYSCPKGNEQLRSSIARLVTHDRGISATSDNICIARGAQMGLYLVIHALLKPGDSIAVENPGFESISETLVRAGINCVPIRVDEEGIDVKALRNACESTHIKAVYVTPRQQYPTTVSMSNQRRAALANLVEEKNLLLIENDFGADYHYTGKPIYPLSSLLSKKHFVYISTFSKIYAPGTRAGFVIASKEAVNALADYRSSIDIQGDIIQEQVMQELIESGEMNRHLKRSTKMYSEKLEYISRLIESNLVGKVSYKRPTGGLAIWLTADITNSCATFAEKLRQQEISIPLFNLGNGRIGLRIGFASLNKEQMQRIIAALDMLITA